MTNYNTVPVTYMRDGIQRYLEDRILPSSFLRALFSKDLAGAYGRPVSGIHTTSGDTTGYGD